MGGTPGADQAGTAFPKPLEDITVRGDQGRDNAPDVGADGASLVRRSAEDISVAAIHRLRNQLAVTLNLKHPQARAVSSDLVKKSDVWIEHYRRSRASGGGRTQ